MIPIVKLPSSNNFNGSIGIEGPGDNFINGIIEKREKSKTNELFKRISKYKDRLNERLEVYEKKSEELKSLYESIPGNIEEAITHKKLISEALKEQIIAAALVNKTAKKFKEILSEENLTKYSSSGLISCPLIDSNTKKNLRNFRETQIELVLNGAKEAIAGCNSSIQSLESWFQERCHSIKIKELNGQFLKIDPLVRSLQKGDKTEEERSAILSEIRGLTADITTRLHEIGKDKDFKLEVDPASIEKNLHEIYENTRFYSQHKEACQEELAHLRDSDSGSYLYKSRLYQAKLLSAKDFAETLSFVRKWVESIPENADAIDLLAATDSYLYAAEKLGELDRSNVHSSLNEWLKTHPEYQYDSNNLPARLEAEELFLRKGQLFAHNGDLGFEASAVYEKCEAIRPDDPMWKVMNSHFSLSCFEFARARECLDRLPGGRLDKNRGIYPVIRFLGDVGLDHFFSSKSRIASIWRKFAGDSKIAEFVRSEYERILNTEFKFYTSCAELGLLSLGQAISWSTQLLHRNILPGSSTEYLVDSLNFANGLLSNSLCTEFCVGKLFYDQPISDSACLSAGVFTAKFFTVPILSWIADAALSDYDTKNALKKGIGRFGNSSVACLGSFATFDANSKFGILPICLAGVPLAARVVLLAVDETNYSAMAVAPAVDKATTLIGGGMAICTIHSIAAPIIQGLAKNLATRLGAEALYEATGGALVGISTAIGGTPLLIAGGVASVVYSIIFDYSYARTAYALQEVNGHYRHKDFEKGNQVLRDSKEWWACFSDQEVILDYEQNSLGLLKDAPEIEDTAESSKTFETEVENADKSLKLLEKTEYYQSVREELVFNKIIGFLNLHKIDKAKEILDTLDINSHVHGMIIEHVISKSNKIFSSSADLGIKYLRDLSELFGIQEYKSIITDYIDYLQTQKNQPEISLQIEGNKDRVKKIENLLQKVEARKILKNLENILLLDGLTIHFYTGQGEKAYPYLDKTGSQTHLYLAGKIIGKVDFLCSQKNYVQAALLLNNACSIENFAHRSALEGECLCRVVSSILNGDDINVIINNLKDVSCKLICPKNISIIKKYQRMLELRQDGLVTAEKKRELLLEMSSLVEMFKPLDQFASLRAQLENEIAQFHILLGQYREAVTFAQSARAPRKVSMAILHMLIVSAKSGQTDAAALDYLEKASQKLEGYEFRGLLQKFCAMEKAGLENRDKEWLAAANDLIKNIKDAPELSELCKMAVLTRYNQYLEKSQFQEANEILRINAIPEPQQLSSLEIIFGRAEVIRVQQGVDGALTYLTTAFEHLKDLKHRNLIQKYHDFLKPDEINKWLHKSGEFYTELHSYEPLRKAAQVIRFRQFEVLIQTQRFDEARDFYNLFSPKLQNTVLDWLCNEILHFHCNVSELKRLVRIFNIKHVHIKLLIEALEEARDGQLAELSFLETQKAVESFTKLIKQLESKSIATPDWISHVLAELYFIMGEYFIKYKDNNAAFREFSNAENLYKNLSNAKNALDRVRSLKMEISGKKEG